MVEAAATAPWALLAQDGSCRSVPAPVALAHQLPHRQGAVRDEESRAPGEIGDGRLADVNAEIVVKRGEDFSKSNRPFAGFAAETIGRADDLPRPDTPAGQDGAVGPGPVVAPGILV